VLVPELACRALHKTTVSLDPPGASRCARSPGAGVRHSIGSRTENPVRLFIARARGVCTPGLDYFGFAKNVRKPLKAVVVVCAEEQRAISWRSTGKPGLKPFRSRFDAGWKRSSDWTLARSTGLPSQAYAASLSIQCGNLPPEGGQQPRVKSGAYRQAQDSRRRERMRSLDTPRPKGSVTSSVFRVSYAQI
jgi:hypothetical protein